MKLKITVTLKVGVLDPQGDAVLRALTLLNFKNLISVRQGKIIELEIQETDSAVAKKNAEKMCESLLANPTIENYHIEVY